MKLKNIYTKIFCAAVMSAAAVSCDFLDVAPPKRADLTDGMKNKSMVENWIFGGYSYIAENDPVIFSRYEGSTDEYVTPDLWSEHDRQKVAYGLLNASNVNDYTWRATYGSIGNVHLFLRELEAQNPEFLTESDKNLYRAHGHFLKAYYYFKLLSMFGPFAIVDEYMPTDTPRDQFPGRSHFDYCVDYIISELDAACSYDEFPSGYALDETYGRGNRTVCAAIKSRLLLYAASPLWNGSFPYPDWKNTTFETPGYGTELVSHKFDIEKWRRAKEAAEDAIEIAKANGREIMDLDDLESINGLYSTVNYDKIYIPGVDTSTPEGEKFLDHVMLMRYLSTSDETTFNHELIFTIVSNSRRTAETALASIPKKVCKKNDGTWQSGYSGISPTLETVEAFYTENGKLPAKDDKFTPEADWLKSANLGSDKTGKDRNMIINLNVNREPRFYAWIAFDGGDVGPLLSNNEPLQINFRSSGAQGFENNSGLRDQCQTGYLNYKFISPAETWSGNFGVDINYDYPSPLYRMSELYLNLAESCAELYMNGEAGELQNALDALNVIRVRAGVPALTAQDCNDDMTIRDWVRAERRIELYAEGHRYYDVRRWCVAEQYLKAGARTGLDSFVSRIENPTFEQLNTRVQVDGSYMWDNRMYLIPLSQDEVYNDPQLVQAPGY